MTNAPTTAPKLLPNGVVALEFVALAIIWGSSFLFMKVALTGLSPTQVVLGRLLLGALTLVTVMTITRRRWPREGRYWAHMLALGLLLCVVPHLLFALAGESIPSGLSSIYNATTPITTMLISLIALPEEKLTRVRTIALLCAAVGVIIIAAPWELFASVGGVDSLLGQLACLGATTCYGIGYVYTRRFLRGFHYDATTLAASQIGMGAAVMLVLTPFIALQPITLDGPIVASMLALGILGTGVAYIWNFHVVRAWGATLSSTVTYLTPLVGVTLGILILQETLHWNEPVGAVIVILGILVGQGRLRLGRLRLGQRSVSDRMPDRPR